MLLLLLLPSCLVDVIFFSRLLYLFGYWKYSVTLFLKKALSNYDMNAVYHIICIVISQIQWIQEHDRMRATTTTFRTIKNTLLLLLSEHLMKQEQNPTFCPARTKRVIHPYTKLNCSAILLDANYMTCFVARIKISFQKAWFLKISDYQILSNATQVWIKVLIKSTQWTTKINCVKFNNNSVWHSSIN